MQIKEMTYEELVVLANRASDAYYGGQDEIMSNLEWDAVYDRIQELELETGVIRKDSPTQNVGSGVPEGKGQKVKHEYSALSLDKTKSVADLVKWAGNRDVWVSWKLDGLTVVLTYDDGKLTRAVTRGNGEIGTDITFLAGSIKDVPAKIKVPGHVVVRGEAVISYPDFERINAELPEDEEPYSNPRNLASGTLSLDDPEEVKRRGVKFIAFTLVHVDSDTATIPNGKAVLDMGSWGNRMVVLDTNGFKTVDRIKTNPQGIQNIVNIFTENVEKFDAPVDGLVICYEDNNYAQTGSVTGHHATRAGYAFKWEDETAETVVCGIEWSASRTGLYNPVVIFEPVELCGTTVSRASMSNLSQMLEKDIKIGDRVTVFKANMIIPQIAENLDAKDFSPRFVPENDDELMNRYGVPTTCPECGKPLVVNHGAEGTMTVRCENPECPAKQLGRIVHFCERDCMNVMGLSKAKIQNLLDLGVITNIPDLLALPASYEKHGCINFIKRRGYATFAPAGCPGILEAQEGWGEDSVKNLMESIKNACNNATFVSFLHAMGIPNFGKGQAKLLKKAVEKYAAENPEMAGESYMSVLFRMHRDGYDFQSIDGFGEVIAGSLVKWLDDNSPRNSDSEVQKIAKYVSFTDALPGLAYGDLPAPAQSLAGLTFVITGDVHTVKNRKELQELIESLEGKATGSVTSKTSYLINNDIMSTSGKNKKAKELGVPVITEEQFREMAGI
jgi:DNA ligase (NAD+)